jgi:hypothetical protein
MGWSRYPYLSGDIQHTRARFELHSGDEALRLGDADFPGSCAKIIGNPRRAQGILHLVDAWVL